MGFKRYGAWAALTLLILTLASCGKKYVTSPTGPAAQNTPTATASPTPASYVLPTETPTPSGTATETSTAFITPTGTSTTTRTVTSTITVSCDALRFEPGAGGPVTSVPGAEQVIYTFDIIDAFTLPGCPQNNCPLNYLHYSYGGSGNEVTDIQEVQLRRNGTAIWTGNYGSDNGSIGINLSQLPGSGHYAVVYLFKNGIAPGAFSIYSVTIGTANCPILVTPSATPTMTSTFTRTSTPTRTNTLDAITPTRTLTKTNTPCIAEARHLHVWDSTLSPNPQPYAAGTTMRAHAFHAGETSGVEMNGCYNHRLDRVVYNVSGDLSGIAAIQLRKCGYTSWPCDLSLSLLVETITSPASSSVTFGGTGSVTNGYYMAFIVFKASATGTYQLSLTGISATQTSLGLPSDISWIAPMPSIGPQLVFSDATVTPTPTRTMTFTTTPLMTRTPTFTPGCSGYLSGSVSPSVVNVGDYVTYTLVADIYVGGYCGYTVHSWFDPHLTLDPTFGNPGTLSGDSLSWSLYSTSPVTMTFRFTVDADTPDGTNLSNTSILEGVPMPHFIYPGGVHVDNPNLILTPTPTRTLTPVATPTATFT